ncbi:type 1 glutamine amidotransferase domain-containing protein [Pseudidiomarina aestuarii]|uniref:type 1 glutamine amidotransferase domain-containing protein n=1 Tax=Pseudidiomarina aestuarii TaxID=624146 RepID=UPI003A96F5B5
MIKKLIVILIVIISVLFASFLGLQSWIKGFVPDKAHIESVKSTQKSELDYLNSERPEYRGKILAVVTNVGEANDEIEAGFEFTELARAYWVFTANGFEVDIASPLGGNPPAVMDNDDMDIYDYAFLNDPDSQRKLSDSIALADIEPTDYQAVYFVGGKGTMFDFPDNGDIQRIVRTMYENDRVVSAVCHGPAALLNVRLDDGSYLLAGKDISGFTNEEELFIIPNASEVFPFLLEDMLEERGGNFISGARYLENVAHDGKLITGQNPWSVWRVAELVVEELGYTPKYRPRTEEERAIDVLMRYEAAGYETAKSELLSSQYRVKSLTVLTHALVAMIDFEIGKGIDLLRLANVSKNR